MIKENNDIRTAARQAGVTLWSIAEHMGISEATMTRMLRKKLSDEEQSRILEVISLIREKEDTRKEVLHETENA